jgi:hypothetical protein
MMMYAQDAMETDKPWERWEFKTKFASKWVETDMHPKWDIKTQYRRKIITININGFDIPEPLKISEIKYDSRYFAPSLTDIYKYNEYVFINDTTDEIIFKMGLAHRTKEDAIIHADALLSFTKNKT